MRRLSKQQNELAAKHVKLIYRAAARACRKFPALDMDDCVSKAGVVFVECMVRYDESKGSVASYTLAAMDKQLWDMGCRALGDEQLRQELGDEMPAPDPAYTERPDGWRNLTTQERRLLELVYGLTGCEYNVKPSRREMTVFKAADRLGISRKSAIAIHHEAICKLRRAADRAEA